MHASGSLKSLVPGHCSTDGFISFYYLTSLLPWIHSVWLRFFWLTLPSFPWSFPYWPSDLEYAIFFPAVTLAAHHTDGLPSLALLSPIQTPEPSMASDSLTGEPYVVLSDAVSYIPYDLPPAWKRQTARIANKGINVPPKIIACRHCRYDKKDKNSLIDCPMFCFLLVNWGKALLPRTQNMWMPTDINTIIILKNGASTSRPFTA